MNYLIIYMSHHGTTEKVAFELMERFGPENTTLVNLENDTVPPLEDFNTVIIGGSVRAGRIQSSLSDFCRKNIRSLLDKRVGLFMCYMNEDLSEMEFEDSFPRELRAHAVAKGMVGGEFLLERMNILERLAVKKVKGVDESVSRLDHHAIEKFIADVLNNPDSKS